MVSEGKEEEARREGVLLGIARTFFLSVNSGKAPRVNISVGSTLVLLVSAKVSAVKELKK